MLLAGVIVLPIAAGLLLWALGPVAGLSYAWVGIGGAAAALSLAVALVLLARPNELWFATWVGAGAMILPHVWTVFHEAGDSVPLAAGGAFVHAAAHLIWLPVVWRMARVAGLGPGQLLVGGAVIVGVTAWGVLATAAREHGWPSVPGTEIWWLHGLSVLVVPITFSVIFMLGNLWRRLTRGASPQSMGVGGHA